VNKKVAQLTSSPWDALGRHAVANKKPETSATFSWIATLKYMGLGIIVGAVGVLMWQADVVLIRLIGVVAIVAGVGLVVMLPFTGGVHTAPCPICGTEIEVMMKTRATC
jgi:sulfite exporter TauE/SafE